MSAEPAPVTHRDMVAAILAVTGWKIPAMSGARVGRLARDLLEAGVFPHDLLYRFGTVDPGHGWWWFRDDWRGRLGQQPDEKGLRESAGRWEQPTAVQLPGSEPAGFRALRAYREARQGR